MQFSTYISRLDHEATLNIIGVLVSIKISSEEMRNVVELSFLADYYPPSQFSVKDIAVRYNSLREHDKRSS